MGRVQGKGKVKGMGQGRSWGKGVGVASGHPWGPRARRTVDERLAAHVTPFEQKKILNVLCCVPSPKVFESCSNKAVLAAF